MTEKATEFMKQLEEFKKRGTIDKEKDEAHAEYIYVGFNEAGEPRATNFDTPGYAAEIGLDLKAWVDMGRSIKRMTWDEFAELLNKRRSDES